MSITIRPWVRDDLEIIRYLLWETWKDSYSSFIPVDDLTQYFNEHCTLKILSDQFGERNNIGFVAEYDDVIAGYENTFYHELEQRLYVRQLYILPVYQNLGIGRKLITAAAQRAKAVGRDKIWLGVMIKNESAVAWYKHMGYEVVEQTPFTMGHTKVDHYIGFIPIGGILKEKL